MEAGAGRPSEGVRDHHAEHPRGVPLPAAEGAGRFSSIRASEARSRGLRFQRRGLDSKFVSVFKPNVLATVLNSQFKDPFFTSPLRNIPRSNKRDRTDRRTEAHGIRRRVNMVGVNMVLAEFVKLKHGLYKSCDIECFEGILLEPCLLQPCVHVAGSCCTRLFCASTSAGRGRRPNLCIIYMYIYIYIYYIYIYIYYIYIYICIHNIIIIGGWKKTRSLRAEGRQAARED